MNRNRSGRETVGPTSSEEEVLRPNERVDPTQRGRRLVGGGGGCDVGFTVSCGSEGSTPTTRQGWKRDYHGPCLGSCVSR